MLKYTLIGNMKCIVKGSRSLYVHILCSNSVF